MRRGALQCDPVKRLEVRCCCQPTKRLGWLPVPDDVHDGQIMRFAVSPARWMLASIGGIPQRVAADIIELPVARFGTMDLSGVAITKLALKSEETPIERLRLIRDFEEAR
jgi:hypothetical protein